MVSREYADRTLEKLDRILVGECQLGEMSSDRSSQRAQIPFSALLRLPTAPACPRAWGPQGLASSLSHASDCTSPPPPPSPVQGFPYGPTPTLSGVSAVKLLSSCFTKSEIDQLAPSSCYAAVLWETAKLGLSGPEGAGLDPGRASREHPSS